MKEKKYIDIIKQHYDLAKEDIAESMNKALFMDEFYGKTKPPTIWERLTYHIGNFRIWLAKIIAGDRYYDDLV